MQLLLLHRVMRRHPAAVQAVHGFYCGLENVREIALNPKALFEALHRTTVQHIGK